MNTTPLPARRASLTVAYRPALWQDLVAGRASFLHQRLAWRLAILLWGVLFAKRRRTVTRWLRAAAIGVGFAAFYYALAVSGRRTGLLAGVLLQGALLRLAAEKIGVAVMMNAGGLAQPLTEIVVLDVFNRLLGIGGADMLPSLIAQVKKPRAAAGGEPAGPLPVSAKQLSLAPATYVGIYANEHWGTLRIENKEGHLAVAIGDLPVPVKSTATDTFQSGIARSWLDTRFVLEDRRVAAVVVVWDGYGDVRFDRKAE